MILKADTFGGNIESALHARKIAYFRPRGDRKCCDLDNLISSMKCAVSFFPRMYKSCQHELYRVSFKKHHENQKFWEIRKYTFWATGNRFQLKKKGMAVFELFAFEVIFGYSGHRVHAT